MATITMEFKHYHRIMQYQVEVLKSFHAMFSLSLGITTSPYFLLKAEADMFTIN